MRKLVIGLVAIAILSGPAFAERAKYFSDKYIICDTDIKNWPEIQKKGFFHPKKLEEIGFIHCSKPSHMPYTVPKYYNGEHRIAWVVLPERVHPPVIYEGEHNQPHVYGPLNMSAVIDMFELKPKPNGTYDIPEEWLPAEYDLKYLCRQLP